MPERVLVTGPYGFAGNHLRKELGEPSFPFEGDILDPISLMTTVRDVRPIAVVHLAARFSVAGSWGGVAEVWRTNVLGTANVVDAVRLEAPAARMLFVSSGEVYGCARRIATPEEAPVEPVSPYGASKAAAELVCAQAGRELDIVVARSFLHVGPGQDERFAVGSWAAQLARLRRRGGGVLKVGDLNVERDLTGVRDVCRAYRLLLQPTVPAGTYNVASGRLVPLRRVLESLVAFAAVPITVEREKARLRRAEVALMAGDTSKLCAATDWCPTIPLERSLQETLVAATVADAVAS
jgi:GDP-4-dehydro-6-deoxy-D-mannose reductase